MMNKANSSFLYSNTGYLGTCCVNNYENEIAKPKKSEPIFTYQITLPDLQSQKSPKRAKALKTRLITKKRCLIKAKYEAIFVKYEAILAKYVYRFMQYENTIERYVHRFILTEHRKEKSEYRIVKSEYRLMIFSPINATSWDRNFNIKSKIINNYKQINIF